MNVDVALCRKRSYLEFGNSWNEEVKRKYCEAKEDAKRVAHIAVHQKAR